MFIFTNSKEGVNTSINTSIEAVSASTEAVTSSIEVKKSVFIADIFSVKDKEEVEEILKRQKEKYKEARHIVFAFVIGLRQEIGGKSDNGEPAGTGGSAIYNLLISMQLTNILVTVARRFGGILLGRGGLLHAYTQSFLSAIERAKVEGRIKLYIRRAAIKFYAPYSVFNSIKHKSASIKTLLIEAEYSESVKATCKVDCAEEESLITLLKEYNVEYSREEEGLL